MLQFAVFWLCTEHNKNLYSIHHQEIWIKYGHFILPFIYISLIRSKKCGVFTFHEHENLSVKIGLHEILLFWHAGVFGVMNPHHRRVLHNVLYMYLMGFHIDLWKNKITLTNPVWLGPFHKQEKKLLSTLLLFCVMHQICLLKSRPYKLYAVKLLTFDSAESHVDKSYLLSILN